ncbi:MAG: aminopeptidase P family protein [Acidobacteria bacterium]|nr:aminopeptidase P family protein [Acidobacteriota bacterium]MBI3662111.1 aminopeptidase P family protein [Acidobacteriota bacterium]
MITRRRFFSSLGIAAGTAAVLGATELGTEMKTGQVASLKPPFRLPVEWYRATVKRFQERLGALGLGGAIVSDPLNRNYLTGIFLTETERPNFLFVPATGEPVAFIPGLDRDMAGSWWVKEFEWYFDYPHAGEYDKVVWKAGAQEDLFKWMLKGLAKRGFGNAKLGIDREPTPSLAKRFREALPEASLNDIAKELLGMRQVKTREELELTQKAIDLHDAMLAFARGFILENGTKVTDFGVRSATEEFGTRTLMAAMGSEVDGKAHHAVGISLEFTCRAGVATAYPHPNQFFYARIAPGQAVQISSVIKIGGYGGEGYRALHVTPMNDLQKKMWDVHTEMTLKQAEFSKAGAKCNAVAEATLAIAQKAGMEKYVYHRPAHGQGMEGHQAPYLSLGDDTMLVENMTVSNEPGLYNLEGGYGYNHSNCVHVQRKRGVIMNKAPLTQEFCWLRI